MYDALSSDYDRFVNWPERLAAELPFIEGQLGILQAGVNRPLRVFDAACGTGQHALALAQRGYQAAGADLSAPMIQQAQANAAAAGLAETVPFVTAGFGELARAFVHQPLLPFDCVLCLGNSLPHLLTRPALVAALADFLACLAPGGRLILQNRNFDAVLAQRTRWMEPQAHREGEHEWLFIRFYDFDPHDLITFHMLVLQRQGAEAWQQRVTSTRLYPLRQHELAEALHAAGFVSLHWYGGLNGTPFEPASSSNLVCVAQRPEV